VREPSSRLRRRAGQPKKAHSFDGEIAELAYIEDELTQRIAVLRQSIIFEEDVRLELSPSTNMTRKTATPTAITGGSSPFFTFVFLIGQSTLLLLKGGHRVNNLAHRGRHPRADTIRYFDLKDAQAEKARKTALDVNRHERADEMKLRAMVIGSFSELEREQIGERTAFALSHLRRTGKVYGPVPFGWRRQGDELVPDGDQQRGLQIARQMSAGGASLRQIATALTEHGIKPKRGDVWHANTVRSVLTSQATAGAA